MSLWDGGHQLRKLDFPESVEKALKQLKMIYVKDNSNIPGLGSVSEEVPGLIVEDFVFGKPRGKASRTPPAIVELQVLDLIVSLYQELTEEKTADIISFSIFQTLFGCVGTDMDRVHTLARLISLAINVNCHLLLDSAAMWMQLQGMQTSSVQLVMESLMRDFSSLSGDARTRLAMLPKQSQHFCCIFISGITIMCKYPGSPLSAQSRPFYSLLLPLLTEWITSDPRLCLVSLFQAQHAQTLQQPQRSSLWTSPSKPNTQTPLPGLIRWTTQGALRNVECCHGTALKFSEQKNSMSALKDNYSNEIKESDLDLLWSKLHLGVLQTLAMFPTLPGAAQLEVVTLGDMKKTVEELVILVQSCGADETTHSAREIALDRMLQVIQVALATGAFRCSLADLKTICMSLPETKLRSILENQHLSNNPPAMHNAS